MKRNRHGLLIDGEIRTPQDFADMLRTPQYEALDDIARRVYVDRNAQGFPERLRAEIKARTRPRLREALKHARNAHAALRRNDLAEFEAERLRASLELQTAAVEFRQVCIAEYTGTQRYKARRPRRRNQSEDAPASLAELVRTIDQERDELGDRLPVGELWPKLFAMLDKLGLDPTESADEKTISFDGGTVTRDVYAATLRRIRRT